MTGGAPSVFSREKHWILQIPEVMQVVIWVGEEYHKNLIMLSLRAAIVATVFHWQTAHLSRTPGTPKPLTHSSPFDSVASNNLMSFHHRGFAVLNTTIVQPKQAQATV